MLGHPALDGLQHRRLVVVLEEREINLFLLAEMSLEQGVDAEQKPLERDRVGHVRRLERLGVLPEEHVVELHDRGRAWVPQPHGNPWVQPELFGLGVQAQPAAEELQNLRQFPAPPLVGELRHASRCFGNARQTGPELVMVLAEWLGQRVFHRPHHLRAGPASASAPARIVDVGFPVISAQAELRSRDLAAKEGEVRRDR